MIPEGPRACRSFAADVAGYATLIVVSDGGGRHEGSGAGSWRARWMGGAMSRADGDSRVPYALAISTIERQV